jgi:hypothetical protein
MAIYNFTIPNFHIASMRSAHSDTLFATTSLVVANAGGGLHHDWGSQTVSLGDHHTNDTVNPNLAWTNVDVPDPTPENPDGGSVSWVFLLANNGHHPSGWVDLANKVADAWAGALAQQSLQDLLSNKTLQGLAELGEWAGAEIAQEALNLLTADCDGQVAGGSFAWTASEVAQMVSAGTWQTTQDNPGSTSPAGCGDNSDYFVTYTVGAGVSPGIWHTDDITASAAAPAAVGDPSGYMFDAQGSQHVVYRSGDGHIHELYWLDAAWHTDDITASAAAPAAVGDPSGYMFDAQGSQHVVYRSGDGHIHELWWG